MWEKLKKMWRSLTGELERELQAKLDAQQKSFTEQFDALSHLIGEQSSQIEGLRDQIAARYRAMNAELSEMESRMVTRLDELETARQEAADYSKREGKTDEADSQGGVKLWTERKAAVIAKHSDPQVFLNYKPKRKPATAEATPKET